ncbi:MAG: hypothetical protein E6Q97_21310 [Desulfurellales bacterium]|nr:MAG: hypothetical protein E6Q97_21310 [Desulfurellales bacterium]
MKTAWLKRGGRYESVRVLREYPEIGAVKVLRTGSPEPWTFKSSEVVDDKPVSPKWAEWKRRREIKEQRESEQIEQVATALAHGKPMTVMEIVDAVNAMPRAITRMEPARVWKIARMFEEANTHTAELQATSRSRKHWVIQRIAPKPI